MGNGTSMQTVTEMLTNKAIYTPFSQSYINIFIFEIYLKKKTYQQPYLL